MAVIDELVNVIGLDIQDDGLDAFESSVGLLIGKLGAAAAGVFSLAKGVSNLFSKAGDLAALSELSDMLGISTDRIQELNAAGAEFGIQPTAISGLLGSLRDAIIESQVLGSSAAEAFAILQVNATDAAGDARSLDAVLRDVTATLSRGVSPEIEEIFSKNLGITPDTIRLLRRGNAEIERLGDRARREGTIFRPEDIEAARAFSRAMGRAQKAVDSLIHRVGKPLLDATRESLDAFLEWVAQDDVKETFDGIGESVRRLTESLRLTLAPLAELTSEIGLLVAELTLTPGPISEFLGFIEELANPFTRAADGIRMLNDLIKEFRLLIQGSEDSSILNFFRGASDTIQGSPNGGGTVGRLLRGIQSGRNTLPANAAAGFNYLTGGGAQEDIARGIESSGFVQNLNFYISGELSERAVRDVSRSTREAVEGLSSRVVR